MVVVQGHRTAASLLMQQSQLPFLKQSRLVKGLGVDLVTASRFAQWLDRYEQETLSLVFTPGEIKRCQTASQPDLFHAICFAAKEAVGKALGTGLVGIQWTEIEALLTAYHSDHQFEVQLQGSAQHYAAQRGIDHWQSVWVAWDDHVLVQTIGLSDA